MIFKIFTKCLSCARPALLKSSVFSSSVYSKFFSCTSIIYNNECEKGKTAVYSNMKNQIKGARAPAVVCAISGLVPFWASPTYMALMGAYDAQLHFGQLAYGAVVLTFLGGIRCGFLLSASTERPNWRELTTSFGPAVLGWLSLLLTPAAASVVLMSGLSLSAYADALLKGYPTWFKLRRFWLTAFAVLSLSASIFCGFLLVDKEMKEFMTTQLKSIR